MEADEEPVPAPSGCLARKDRRWDFFMSALSCDPGNDVCGHQRIPVPSGFKSLYFVPSDVTTVFPEFHGCEFFFSCTELPEAKTGL